MMTKRFLFLLASLLLPASAALGGGAEYRIKFATVAPEGSTWVKAMNELDAEVRARTEGRLGFLIYAGGIAGDELDVLKKIRIGQLHCAAFSGVGLGAVLPAVRVLDLPLLVHGYAEMDHLRTELTPYFAEAFSAQGFHFLSWAEVGPVHLLSKRAIRTVDDLRGAKVWAWSGDPIAKETFNALGVHPIPLPVTDVNTALNTGMIDTVYAPPLGALALQWQTSLQYLSDLPLAYANAAVLISNAFFKQLPSDLAQCLTEIFPKRMNRLTLQLREQVQQAKDALQASGLQLVPAPAGEALMPFEAMQRRVADTFAGDLYPPELLEKVYQILGRETPQKP